jgi:hypothetical protein
VINTAVEHTYRNRVSNEGENEPIGEKIMSYGNLLSHGDILLHQSQKKFNSCDLGGGKFK